MVLLTRMLFFVALVMLPAQAFGLPSDLDSGGFQLAYIDPGAGSFIFQALVAALAGIAVMSRLYWSKIKKFFGLAPADDDEDSDADDE